MNRKNKNIPKLSVRLIRSLSNDNHIITIAFWKYANHQPVIVLIHPFWTYMSVFTMRMASNVDYLLSWFVYCIIFLLVFAFGTYKLMISTNRIFILKTFGICLIQFIFMVDYLIFRFYLPGKHRIQPYENFWELWTDGSMVVRSESSNIFGLSKLEMGKMDGRPCPLPPLY